MDLFNNPWVVGIGGGILSGVVVTLISRGIFSKKDNKEYHQKIVTANQEILYAIRPSISEQKIPKTEIIEAIKAATAQKYDIEPQDLYKLEEIVDILIKEVMDSSFISMDTKTNYCNDLASLKVKIHVPTEQTEEGKTKEISTESTSYYRYREKMWNRMSAAIGIMTAAMTMMVSLFPKDSLHLLPSDKILPIFVPMLVGIVAVMTSVLFTNFKRKFEKAENENKEKKNK